MLKLHICSAHITQTKLYQNELDEIMPTVDPTRKFRTGQNLSMDTIYFSFVSYLRSQSSLQLHTHFSNVLIHIKRKTTNWRLTPTPHNHIEITVNNKETVETNDTYRKTSLSLASEQDCLEQSKPSRLWKLPSPCSPKTIRNQSTKSQSMPQATNVGDAPQVFTQSPSQIYLNMR